MSEAEGSQFGPAVRQIREGRGMERHELAERAGISTVLLARIERQETLPWGAVRRIRKGLGMTWFGLFSIVAKRER
jgi:transcriptional regulator with XRE-family HTH domain